MTALDVFVLICFFCVFAALLEFAIINFITVTMTRYDDISQEQISFSIVFKRPFDFTDKKLRRKSAKRPWTI